MQLFFKDISKLINDSETLERAIISHKNLENENNLHNLRLLSLLKLRIFNDN